MTEPLHAVGRVYVVGTPIGNLEDLTLRAKRILETADLVVCEDTRVTKKLLSHYGLSPAVTAIHHHTSPTVIASVLDRVTAGQSIAVVTDAGMPGISDPGGKLVAAALERGLIVESVPGPSAVTTALSLAGVPADQYLFLGFLPHKKGRATLLTRISQTEETVVLYESPHRLMKTLTSLAELIPNRLVVVCRELTKLHEQVVRGTAEETCQYYVDHPDQVRGECVIIIGPATKRRQPSTS